MTCKDWFSVYPADGDQWTNTISVPNYYNVCSQIVGYYNIRGYQLPRTGVAYADFSSYYEPNPNERIYLEVKLVSPLKKDQYYKISFYVALINKSMYYTSNGIGAYLSKDKIEKFNYFALEVSPHIISDFKIIDTLNWTETSSM